MKFTFYVLCGYNKTLMRDTQNLRLLIFFVVFISSFLFFNNRNVYETKTKSFNQKELKRFIYSEVYAEDNSITKKINSFFQNRYKLGAFNGAVLYSAHDTIFYKKAFGFANRRKKDTLTMPHRY